MVRISVLNDTLSTFIIDVVSRIDVSSVASRVNATARSSRHRFRVSKTDLDLPSRRVDVQRGEAREASGARPPGFQGGDQVLASDAKAR